MSVKVDVRISDSSVTDFDLYIEHQSGKTMMYELSADEAKETVNSLLNAINELENGKPQLSKTNEVISSTFTHTQRLIRRHS